MQFSFLVPPITSVPSASTIYTSWNSSQRNKKGTQSKCYFLCMVLSANPFSLCCTLRDEPKTFATSSTWSFGTHGSMRYCFLNKLCSWGFIHLSGLNHASRCKSLEIPYVLHSLVMCGHQICLGCWAAGWCSVDCCWGLCRARNPSWPSSSPLSRPSARAPWLRLLLDAPRSRWSFHRIVGRQRHCMSPTRQCPCRYRGNGFDQSYRLLAAHRLAWPGGYIASHHHTTIGSIYSIFLLN
jgi:hypothetical protein